MWVERLSRQIGWARAYRHYKLLIVLIIVQFRLQSRTELVEAVVIKRHSPRLAQEGGNVRQDALLKSGGKAIKNLCRQPNEAGPVAFICRDGAKVHDRHDSTVPIEPDRAVRNGPVEPFRGLEVPHRVSDKLRAKIRVGESGSVRCGSREGFGHTVIKEPAGKIRPNRHGLEEARGCLSAAVLGLRRERVKGLEQGLGQLGPRLTPRWSHRFTLCA
mmetsp:Transcript_30697/g.93980  ORF Transcript_30697/g.93980 Transcript_30697/m.93980 type:complete len:216 (+) Transcript_30697:400-1047(+)